MIGRKDEISTLQECLESKRPEFLVVYGRRRVGKTYLIKEFFNDDFSFYATGVAKLNTRKQLKVFNESLIRYGSKDKTIPKDWFEAFARLETLLTETGNRNAISNKMIVFLDELPWMDTPRSDFKSALDYFWNSWGSSRKDLLFIVCGSATSWIINNILKDTGGFYNRITRQIHLMPFCLRECEQLLESNGMHMTRKQMIESYMVLGGIPYYLNYLKSSLSLAQNIDMLFFHENSPLRYEYNQLFSALFKKSGYYSDIVEELAKKKSGMTRNELLDSGKTPAGKELTKCLNELEQCGFIRRYRNTTKKNDFIFQLIDPFVLFHLTFIEGRDLDSWLDILNTPSYFTWCGLSFERVCLLHVSQIKDVLGIRGISSNEYSWRSSRSTPGAQIDLIIDRKDDVMNICEMKYSQEEYTIDSQYEKNLLNKIDAFRTETKTKKALLPTMITLDGLKKNQYSNSIACSLSGDDLFC